MLSQRFRILAIGFAVLLLLPTLDQIFSFSSQFKSTENRKPTPFPTFSFQKAVTFAKQFNLYYKESFGFRSTLVYAYSVWKFNTLRQSPLPEKVIVGKNGWLFLGNNDNDVVNQHRGLNPFNDKEVERISARLSYWQQTLARLGIKFYVVIAPDAHNIYREYLPDALHHTNGKTRLDILRETVKQQAKVVFIDLSDTLITERSTHAVFYKTDSHWNNYGAFISCAKLISRIQHDYRELKLLQLTDYHLVKTTRTGGDLAALFMFQDKMTDTFYNLFPNSAQTLTGSTEIPNEKSGLPSYKLSGPRKTLPKLMFIGDSYSTSMMQFLGSCFRESYFIRGNQIDLSLVKKEQPDILVIEIAERNINLLVDL